MQRRAVLSASRSGVYEHGLVVIAEGLKSLGWMVEGDEPYWLKSESIEDWLIPSAVTPGGFEADLFVVGSGSLVRLGTRWALPGTALEQAHRAKLSVYLDESDGSIAVHGVDPSEFDVVLKCHFVDGYRYPANVHPWAFGLSDRIIEALQHPLDSPRRAVVMDNARNAHPVRELAARTRHRWLPDGLAVDSSRDVDVDPDETPLDALYRRQSGGRHDRRYYARLRESLASTAFGGWFGSPLLVSERPDVIGKGIRLLQRLNGNARPLARRQDLWRPFPIRFIGQYDSWRWWESLAAGCCTLHVDLDRYRCRLPVQPIRGEHYLGLDFGDPGRLRRELDTVDLAAVGRAGRRWALANYSPEATARRLLDLVA